MYRSVSATIIRKQSWCLTLRVLTVCSENRGEGNPRRTTEGLPTVPATEALAPSHCWRKTPEGSTVEDELHYPSLKILKSNKGISTFLPPHR